jgi:hypothetical protein
MPREGGFAKQTQIMLLGRWSTDDITSRLGSVSIKLEPLLRRYSWKKLPQKYGRIPYGLDARSRRQIDRSNRWAGVCKYSSTPCTIHFDCLQSGPNDSIRVRPLTGILRRARVKIFILNLAYGLEAFGSNFPDFRAIWLGTTKPKLQNRYGAADQNIRTFISNLGYLPWYD